MRDAGRADDDGVGPLNPESVAFVGDVLSSVLAVVGIGVLLYSVSGVWPPLVAIESPSMTPNMHTGDLVFVMEEHRFPAAAEHDGTGVVPAHDADGYASFRGAGDVVVYEPDGNGGQTPIIHRAMFWVEEGENWYDEADPAYTGGAPDCDALAHCPAPHAGFITKGDANSKYDQVGPGPISEPVRPAWIVGTAEFRVPGLGWVRLTFGQAGPPLSAGATPVSAPLADVAGS